MLSSGRAVLLAGLVRQKPRCRKRKLREELIQFSDRQVSEGQVEGQVERGNRYVAACAVKFLEQTQWKVA
jgi:hypothetical protein